MLKLQNKKHKKYYGFTLVELIIVITILAILATISFVSFSGYTSKSRDSNRLFSLKEISKALEIQKEMTSKYPQPDDVYNTGGIPGIDETLFNVGLIGKNVSNYIKLGSIPLDPKTGNEYLYGVSRDNKNFQIAGTLENLQSSIIVPVTYADAGMQAVVEGNYKGVIKFSTGSSNYIGNIPSLIFSKSGTYTIEKRFVVNKGKNLPYSVDGEKLGTGLSETEVLKELHNKDSLTLTGVIVTNPKSETEIKEISDKLGVSDLVIAENLGNKEYVEKYASVGGDSSNTVYSCIGQLPTDNYSTSNTELLTQNYNWQSNSSADKCYFECINGYTGSDCSVAPSVSFTNNNGTTTKYLADNTTGRFVFDSGSTPGGTTVVKDVVTGLYWQSEGITQGKKTWDASKTYCSELSLGGYDDWRMPDVMELLSIVDYNTYDPYIDTSYFTSSTIDYWTSVTHYKYSTNAMKVGFGNGSVGGITKTVNTTVSIRCVR